MADAKGRAVLPPDPLPPLPDPSYDGKLGPYSASPLRDVVGTRINADAIGHYRRRSWLTSPMCSAKTCGHPELEAWLGDVGGTFDPHSRLAQPPPSEWPLSGIIPRMSAWGARLPFEVAPATYMIDYLSLNTDPLVPPTRPWVNELRSAFPEGSRLLLSHFGPGGPGPGSRVPLTMGLWTLQGAFWSAPFLDQFDAIVSPGFSPFSDDPHPQALFGERMDQIFGQEATESGKTFIPSIAWADEDSLRRQVELWVSQYPKVNTILLDCYGTGIERVGWAWHWLFAMEKYCAPHRNIRWLLTGMTSGWIVKELNRIFEAKNYSLITTASLQISATRGTTDKEIMAKRFRDKVGRLEDLRAGRVIADSQPRPDHWPMFKELISPES